MKADMDRIIQDLKRTGSDAQAVLKLGGGMDPIAPYLEWTGFKAVDVAFDSSAFVAKFEVTIGRLTLVTV